MITELIVYLLALIVGAPVLGLAVAEILDRVGRRTKATARPKRPASRATANAQRPWPIDRSAAANLERVRRVLDALADKVNDLRTSEYHRDNTGPEIALLQRLLNRADVTEEDLGDLSEDLHDLESREDPETTRRAFPGGDW